MYVSTAMFMQQLHGPFVMGGIGVMRALKLALALGAVGVVGTTSQSQAVTIVIGGGLATECYATAEYGDAFTAFDICTRALQNQALSVRDRAATYVNRSVIRLRVRDFSGAIADCEQSIQRWPQLSEPYVNRGAALINMERPQEALRDLDLAINMGLEKVHLAYYNRGLAKEKMNDARGAYADYRRALELDPTFTLANEQLQRFLVNGMRVQS
jgi:tetratricopeptide (TPR) repeat protein